MFWMAFVGFVIGKLEFAVGSVSWVGSVVKAAVGQGAAEASTDISEFVLLDANLSQNLYQTSESRTDRSPDPRPPANNRLAGRPHIRAGSR